MTPAKMPKVKDIPVPTRSSEQVQRDADNQRQRVAGETSSVSWLTGGLGVPKNMQKFSAAQLLGGF